MKGGQGPLASPLRRGGGVGGCGEEAGEAECLSFIDVKTSNEAQAYQGTTAKAEAMA